MLNVAGITGCTNSDQPQHQANDMSCQEREARDYPALEKVAARTLVGEPHSLARVGACEDTGSARATVQATISQWNSRAVGVRYLKGHGWQDYRGGLLLSMDHMYAAEATEVRAADAETSVVVLTFTRFVGDT